MSRYIRIERMANGFELECDDPDIVASNQKPNSKWKDPGISLAFETKEKLLTFLKTHLDKIFPAETYDSAFAKAITSLDEKDD